MANDKNQDLAAKYGKILEEADEPTKQTFRDIAEAKKAQAAEAARPLGERTADGGQVAREAGATKLQEVGHQQEAQLPVGASPGHAGKSLMADYSAGKDSQAVEQLKQEPAFVSRYGGAAPAKSQEPTQEKAPEPEKEH